MSSEEPPRFHVPRVSPGQLLIRPKRLKSITNVLTSLIVVAGLLTTSSYPGMYTVLPDQKVTGVGNVTNFVTPPFPSTGSAGLTPAFRFFNTASFLLSITTILNCLFVMMILLSNLPEDNAEMYLGGRRIPLRPANLDYFSEKKDGKRLLRMLSACYWSFMCTLVSSLVAMMIGVYQYNSLGYAVTASVLSALAVGHLVYNLIGAARLSRPKIRKSSMERDELLKLRGKNLEKLLNDHKPAPEKNDDAADFQKFMGEVLDEIRSMSAAQGRVFGEAVKELKFISGSIASNQPHPNKPAKRASCWVNDYGIIVCDDPAKGFTQDQFIRSMQYAREQGWVDKAPEPSKDWFKRAFNP